MHGTTFTQPLKLHMFPNSRVCKYACLWTIKQKKCKKQKHQLSQTTMKNGQETGGQCKKIEAVDVWEVNGE